MAKKVDSSVHIFETGSAKEALEYASDNEIKALFLDIHLEDYSGIELAKQIRKMSVYEFAPIVFITAILTRELEAFRQIHCYDYIVKPFTEEELENAFKKILINYVSSTDEDKEEKFKLEFKGFTLLIDMKDIMYVEYKNRIIVITTRKETIKYRHIALKKFKKSLPENFIQIHQSIIVNMQYIEIVELCKQRLKLTEADVILPVGRSYLKEFGGKINDL